MSLNGFVNVSKPAGKTSFSIVAWLRRLTGEKRVGHLGTLDPFATGVLPLCLGKATRLARYLADSRKTYLARVCLGIATETYDSEGKITDQSDPSGITEEMVEQALSHFRGTIVQVPPVYSALKYRGERMYKLARNGVPVQPEPREVTIYTLDMVNFQPPFVTFTVVCSKGTYIRSLAHDIGRTLDCGGYLAELTRTAAGPFPIESAFLPETIEDLLTKGNIEKFLIATDEPLADIPAVTLATHQEAAVRTGVSIRLDYHSIITPDLCRAYTSNGKLLAILRYLPLDYIWHPETVLLTI